jgi:acetylornithine/succinyldiaminopimelate/putrescine aminotransferase
VTIGKALTNGLIPLSACLINNKILKEVKTQFNWGHTWQPNMYGVRVANRCIELIKERMAYSSVIEKNLNDIGNRLKSKGLVRNVIGNGVWASFVPEPTPIPISLAEIDKAGMSATTNENTIKTIIPLIADDIYFEELEKRLTVCFSNIKEQRTQGILL